MVSNETETLWAEVERLQRWKAEATEVILGLQDVGKALGLRPGERITGESATEAAERLTTRTEAAEAKVARVEALLDEGEMIWPDAPEWAVDGVREFTERLRAALDAE